MTPNMRIPIAPHGFVHLLDSMGTDLTVSNAARVSFNKRKSHFDQKDQELVAFLAREQHTAPFRHPHLTVHIKAPIFVLRQAMRHNVGISWSEISGRYVDLSKADTWTPEGQWRRQDPNIKQGSSDHLIDNPTGAQRIFDMAIAASQGAYVSLLELGVCREQARTVLPLAIYSEVYMTGSLQAMAHFVKLRLDGHAQAEIRPYGDAVHEILRMLYPVATEALL